MASGWRFDFYYSLSFWAAFAGAAVLLRTLASRPRARAWALLAVSTVMLLAIPQLGARDLLVALGVCAVTLSAGRVLCLPEGAVAPRVRSGVAVAGVLAVLGLLALFKYHFLQDLLWRSALGRDGAARYVFALGVSYFSFKAIHVLVDAHGRKLQSIEPLHVLNYVLFFPSFISGPINRYPTFAAQLEATPKAPASRDLAAGGERIVHGLFKKFVLVTIVAPHILSTGTVESAAPTAAALAAALVATALYFYFDFSAYTDLAIGAARIIGIDLPENFDHPFLRRNIRELWANWHMTLTGWLIDYVYWPVVRKLRNLEYFRTRPVLLSVVGMNATFLACGLWHGGAANFVLWGAYHGAGISVLNVYQRQKKRIRNKWAQRWFASPYSRAVGAMSTFCFFTFGISLFVLDVERWHALANALLQR